MSETLPAEPTQLLSAESKKIVVATAQVVGEHAEQITAGFYPRMFAEHPELLRVFNQGNQATGEQSRALAASVVAYAVQLVDPGAPSFAHVLRRIAYKHVSLGIRPEQYTIVGRNLLAAVGEVLGDAVTPEVAAAWDEVYWLFATQLIAEEARLYQQAQIDAAHPLRPYRLVRRIEETADVASFVLEPADGLPLPEIAAGQYVSVFVDLPDGRRQPRQYTVSSTAFGHRLQITVLRVRGVNGAPDGMVSSYLHDHLQPGDTVELSAPAGDFVVKPSDIPLLLASAGAGITTVLPIVEEIARPAPAQDHRCARRPCRQGSRIARDRAAHRPSDRRLHCLLLVREGRRRRHARSSGLHGSHGGAATRRRPGLHVRPVAIYAPRPHLADRTGGAGESDPVRGVRPGFVGRADPGVRSNRRRSVGRLHRFPGASARTIARRPPRWPNPRRLGCARATHDERARPFNLRAQTESNWPTRQPGSAVMTRAPTCVNPPAPQGLSDRWRSRQRRGPAMPSGRSGGPIEM